MDDLICEFLAETNEGLAELDIALLQLERVPGDEATLSFIFRLVHTIKGTCGFLNLPRLERVAHAAENVLGRIRDHRLAASPATISVILAGLDRIKQIVAEIGASGVERSGDDRDVIAALAGVANGSAANGQAAAVVAIAEATEAMAEAGTSTIRLDIGVLENLMMLVSELVLTRNQLLQLARSHENSPFTASLQRLSHLTSDLQEGVMKTRMQPIGQAWTKLPRLVRDLAQELGKPLELVMHGQHTELDRQVIELIRDPLTHMIRNSADHGLELPEARRAAGKPATGTVTLSACHAGGHVLIRVTDDGAGLPMDRLRAKALSSGLASAAELAAMPDGEVQRFIFHAGLSTAAAVTSVSGRGVGLDVVKTNIEKIGGTVEVASVAGQGTTFTIKIPLTLAIISALTVEAEGQRFAIPQGSVVELVRPAARAGASSGPWIDNIGGTPLLQLRDRLLPLIDLGKLLQIDPQPDGAADTVIVVLSVGAAAFGVLVDRVFGTEEIVVKPVPPILRHIAMFAGNTILGDGSVIMILDPNGIATAAGLNGATASKAAAATAAPVEQTGGRSAMLLFRRDHGGPPCAVPLGLVARIEAVPCDRIERASGQLALQYGDQLMPLLHIGTPAADAAGFSILVFSDRGRSMGLLVAEIIDVVDGRLAIELAAGEPGLLGSAVIAGCATDILDVGYWMTRVAPHWFRDGDGGPAYAVRKRLLVVEDSAFFRQLVVPALSAAGYFVTAVDSPAKALALQAGEARFDAIVSDIEMPGMDGLSFARLVRSGGPWAGLPLIALSGRSSPEDAARGRAAGFTDYVAKYEREPLLASLQRCLSPAFAASASPSSAPPALAFAA